MSQERPTPPGDYECCENGCTLCVWDTYFEELNAWNAAQKALEEAEQNRSQSDSKTTSQTS